MSDFVTQVQERMRYRLIVLGVPRYMISPLLREISTWITHNGQEWTISRLKSLKVDLFRMRSGLSPLTWIRKNRRGEISGVFGSLFRWADLSEAHFRIAIQVLMVYTLFVFTKVTEKQLKKFVSGVTAQPTIINREIINSITKEAKVFASKKSLPLPQPIYTYQGSPSKKAPRMFGRKSVVQSEKVMDELHHLSTTDGTFLIAKYPRLFLSLVKGMEFREKYYSTFRKPTYDYTCNVGNIAFIQEPGGKLRSVASPYRLFQMVLKPLGDKLYQIARIMPWDCTHDQSAAFEPISNALEKGIKVYSVDLSSATDYFPLEIQVACIRSLLFLEDSDYINLWVDLSRGFWKLPNGETIRWNRGQPLGMFPSFAAFTISHGLLLKSLLKRKWNGEFYVVGDDVVILDDQLATDYMRTLDEIGCPYSADKTLQSEKIAEFAGKIITSSGVYPQMKWRELSDDNFLDLCRALGPRSRSLLRGRQKKIFDLVKNLVDPIGLNFSCPGDNLVKMIERTLESPFCHPSRSVLNSLMGLRRRSNNHLCDINPDETINSEVVELIARTFDEKVGLVMKQTIFNSWEAWLPLIEGLASLPEAIRVKDLSFFDTRLGIAKKEDSGPRLPLQELPPSRVSTLEKYEAALKL